MKIYFIRHGLNAAAQLATGQHNAPITYLTEEGKAGVQASALTLKQTLGNYNPERVYIYTPGLVRTMQTTDIVSDTLGVPGYNCYVDDFITGRDYGEITRISLEQEIPESDIKKPKFILSHLGLTMEYLRAQMGKANNAFIEPKSDFVERIDLFMDNLFLKHNEEDIVIISANSDMWNHLRKSEYFNSPLVEFSTKEKLAPAEFASIDIDPKKMQEYRTNAMAIIDGLNYVQTDELDEGPTK